MTKKDRDGEFLKEYFALRAKIFEIPPPSPGIRVYGDYASDREACGGGSRLVAATNESE